DVTAVRWGQTSVPFTIVDDTRITTTVPPGPANTKVGLSLTTPLGDWVLGPGEWGEGIHFTYFPRPTITRLQPAHAAANAWICIEGTGLELVTSPARPVRFGDAEAPYVSCSAGSCTVVVPPGTGTVPVTVGTPGGVSP